MSDDKTMKWTPDMGFMPPPLVQEGRIICNFECQYTSLQKQIERLRKALDFYHCGCAEGTCNVTRPKFKGIRCGMTARKALEGKDD